MQQNEQNLNLSKTSLHKKHLEKDKSSNQQKPSQSKIGQSQLNPKSLFSHNKIDTKLLLKLTKNLKHSSLDEKDKNLYKSNLLENQNEEAFKEVKNSDQILKGVLKLNFMKSQIVGFQSNMVQNTQVIVQNFKYRKIRALRITKPIYEQVLLHYHRFFDFLIDIQIRQKNLLNFANFIHTFFQNRNKEMKKEFFNGFQRLQIAYNIFEFQRNQDLDHWKKGSFKILQDYDKQPKSIMSLIGNNSNYFKFLTFFDYTCKTQAQQSKESFAKHFFNVLKQNQQKEENKKKGLKQFKKIIKKIQNKQRQNCFDIIQQKKSKLQIQFLFQSIQLARLNKIKDAFESIRNIRQIETEKQTEFNNNENLEFKGTQAKFQIQKSMSNIKIMNIPKKTELDLEAFIKYIEYLKFLREKHAFYKILMGFKVPKQRKVIHGRISVLKRPIQYEEWTDGYQQFLAQEVNDQDEQKNLFFQRQVSKIQSQKNFDNSQFQGSHVEISSPFESVRNFKEYQKHYSHVNLNRKVKINKNRPPAPLTLEDNIQTNHQKSQNMNMNKSGIIIKKKKNWVKKYRPSFYEERSQNFDQTNERVSRFEKNEEKTQGFNQKQVISRTKNFMSKSSAHFLPTQQVENEQNYENQKIRFSNIQRTSQNGNIIKRVTKRKTTKRTINK